MEKEGSVRAIGRGLAVLKVINRHGSLNMMAIAKLSAMPYPTACRIVDTLIDEGMVEREPNRKFYRATAQVVALSRGFHLDDELAAAAKGPIDDLTKRFLWPVSVCSRVGLTMMIRESTHRTSPKTLNMYYPGYTIPILGCSAGLVYLAYCDEGECSLVLESLAQEEALEATFDLANVEGALVGIRTTGFGSLGSCHYTANPGKTSALSAPILADGMCEGTVTIAFASTLPLSDAIGLLAAPLCEAGRLIGTTIADKAALIRSRQSASD